MTNKLALFDCDGTMVDSQANICASMDQAFEKHGLVAPDHHLVRRIVGLSLIEAVSQLLPEGDAETVAAVTQSYKDGFFELREAGGVHEPLYDGLLETLEQLEASGWVLGVATGKSDRGLRHVLETHGLGNRFVTLQTADRHPSKPHPAMVELAMAEAGAAPETTAMIGDTSFDMAMAVNAKVRAVGVDWGYHDEHELIAAGAEIVAATMADLNGILNR
ncbi:MAG: HAD-IA family hydrolase [Sphingomonadales bacterium]|nr:HAD-IA family hydrolase [Sphingomonadales bacterium]PIX64104.1 MAG: haloacid dehalogenase [Sphingomonadales bacterium CG_4_10_14_3_um_filter_58_15]NCO49079.1 HAD-IA family hydrolase [Sphingomonadales bacterium]NCO99434.1 HAD-IA family hydrolase [Sphingomonadales bacterium]NCP27086.1 HAD-IA family hydrolase [Sphingomonadales bacterium]